MITFAKFKKLKIDTSPIGWEQTDKETAYFCTPKGAKIIGRAGVDGIHYCTVRGLGDTIFAVSPMNTPGHYVHPIARNFEDFLRLLLTCLDLNLIEQAWAWDEDQLTEQIEEVRNSEYFDETPLKLIRERCELEPMDEPYEYLYRLQKSFHYTQIPFTDEYFEMMEDNAEWQPPEWKVTMEGGFFPERGKAGKEIALNKAFEWGNEIWHIPSAYLCKGGVVIDFFAEIDPEAFIRFRKEAEEVFENGRRSQKDEEAFLRMNPVSVDFRPSITVNGVELLNKRGHGDAWYPASCRDEGAEEDVQAKYLVEHYGFDLSRIWIIRRCTFPSDANFSEVTSIGLKMVRGADSFTGIHFTNPVVGDTFTFTHPVYNTEHMLTVTEYEEEEMEQSKFASEEWIFPTHLTAMQYTITPNISHEEVSVQDCSNGDHPRRRENAPKPDCDFCSAIGVIRSSDGPTAVIVGTPQTAEVHSACSALHFEKQDSVEWRMRFRVKTVDDKSVELL